MTDVLERLPGVAEAYVDFDHREAWLIVNDDKFPGEPAAIDALRGIGKVGKPKGVGDAPAASASD